jgi:tRNA pseudouridine55 synthase
MRRYAVIEKNIGETPLMAIEGFRKSNPSLSQYPMTYAGRLDPMASGKLVVLIGDECKRRTKYDHLDKSYVFEVLLGFQTDTGDVLGLSKPGTIINVSDHAAHVAARSQIGPRTLPYPAFSSKTVKGKPLFTYALENELSSIEIPCADVRVHSMRYLDRITLPKDELIEHILNKIDQLKVRDDVDELGAGFRKEEIIKQWWSLQDRRKTPCVILRYETTVSAGTYIRTLAPLLAQTLGTKGLAYSIKRTKIGRYLPILGPVGLWTRTL